MVSINYLLLSRKREFTESTRVSVRDFAAGLPCCDYAPPKGFLILSMIPPPMISFAFRKISFA